MTVIDDYLKKIDPEKRRELERIRRIAKQIVPKAKEVISYKMPTLTHRGKPFLGFNLHKNHIGVYPFGGAEIERLKEKLMEQGYGFSIGAIRVPFDKPISEDLLKELILLRVARIDQM